MFNRLIGRSTAFVSLVTALLALGAGRVSAQQEAKGSGTVAIHAARVIDGTGAAPIVNGVVVITDDKLVAGTLNSAQ